MKPIEEIRRMFNASYHRSRVRRSEAPRLHRDELVVLVVLVAGCLALAVLVGWAAA